MISKIILGVSVATATLFTTNLNLAEAPRKIDRQALYEEIVSQGIEYPEIVWAQAILESGNFTSKVFQNNNNLFGMRMPERRSTVALRSSSGYAVYDTWQESVHDYKLYQEYYFKDRKISKQSYFSHLNRSYCEIGIQYSQRVKKIISKMYEPNFKSPGHLNNGVFGDNDSLN